MIILAWSPEKIISWKFLWRIIKSKISGDRKSLTALKGEQGEDWIKDEVKIRMGITYMQNSCPIYADNTEHIWGQDKDNMVKDEQIYSNLSFHISGQIMMLKVACSFSDCNNLIPASLIFSTWWNNGISLNFYSLNALLGNQVSWYYTKYGKSQKYDAEFHAAEKRARKEKLNIWADPELTKKYLRLKSKWGQHGK